MKTLLVTTPIRPTPTDFPPIGSLSIISYLRRNGFEIDFYNIDSLRPSDEEAVQYIADLSPQILAISAVVSTAYEYTKNLIRSVKEKLPNTLVIVGGSLAASSEILLRCAGADLCATGEGEKVMLNVIKRAQKTLLPSDFQDIPGLILLNNEGKLINTGYEVQLDKTQIYNFSWGDLEKSSNIENYIFKAFNNGEPMDAFAQDRRTFEPHRREKYYASLPGAKGCVARCTFCHRWDKGIRYIPPNLLNERISELVERFNVGFLNIIDENFGTDKKWLHEFCEMMSGFDILFRVAGMRVNCIDPDRIKMLKNAGCVSIVYGMETGSEKMLEVMEKKTKLKDNFDAIKWTVDEDLWTVVQLVIGMPGESPSTILDTAKFSIYANTLKKTQKPWNVSVNYAQALPGTPLYEYALRKGLISSSLEGEEAYLLKISDSNAADEEGTLNLTSYPYFLHRSFREFLMISTLNAHIKKFGKENYTQMLLADTRYFTRKESEETGYFNTPKKDVQKVVSSDTSDTIHDVRHAEKIVSNKLPTIWSLLKNRKRTLLFVCYPEICHKFLVLLPLFWIIRSFQRNGLISTFIDIFFGLYQMILSKDEGPSASLRKIVFKEMPKLPNSDEAMEPLRRGR
jgi:anaerobic magnesium-protoporphyrin IX monomethyl ester cyclase